MRATLKCICSLIVLAVAAVIGLAVNKHFPVASPSPILTLAVVAVTAKWGGKIGTAMAFVAISYLCWYFRSDGLLTEREQVGLWIHTFCLPFSAMIVGFIYWRKEIAQRVFMASEKIAIRLDYERRLALQEKAVCKIETENVRKELSDLQIEYNDNLQELIHLTKLITEGHEPAAVVEDGEHSPTSETI